jgi:hypothetical protein
VQNYSSKTNLKEWNPNTESVRWSVVVSKRAITKTIESNGELFNQPAIRLREIHPKELIIKWVKTNEQAEALLAPGTYDVLIVIDRNFDQIADSYLGTTKRQIKLHNALFEAGKVYSITVGEDSIATMMVK